jgi:predicted dehydrogenase
VVDLLRWYLAPSEVREVYAISQREVLGYTPDIYDAFLTFDSGAKVRVKAEWIKHIDELVEFYIEFSGSEGTLIYNKRGGFNTAPGWRANLASRLSPDDLLRHQRALAERGSSVRALVHHPSPSTGWLSAGVAAQMLSLDYQGLGYGDPMDLVGCCLDSIQQGTLSPTSWKGPGPLPTHHDGLKQTQIVSAIVSSAEQGRVITVG